MSDIIDDIDALVDWQLDQYDNRSGYDHNVRQVDCWHCGREWHGMAITARIERLREDWQDANRANDCGCDWCTEGAVSLTEAQAALDAYRIADDDSEVLCPGPDFIGPWATPGQVRRMQVRSSALRPIPGGVVSILEAGEWRSIGTLNSIGINYPPEYQFPTQRSVPMSMHESLVNAVTAWRGSVWRRPEPESAPVDTRTPQERALPRPSTDPPIWARDVSRVRRANTRRPSS